MRTSKDALSVGEVARLAHVSVRTLHHYDEIGLLKPAHRSEAGYRLYGERELERLQAILFYRELGFDLEAIRELLAEPARGHREALLAQRELVARELKRFEAMLELIDKSLASIEGGVKMDKKEMFEVFGEFDPSAYEAEVEERWGDTEAYRESARRAARYGKADWQRFKEENEQVNAEVAALMDEGVPPSDLRAMDAVERARLLIDRWFYPCSRTLHAKLGEMYVADERFTATYERIRPGMARYLREATAANATRQTS